MKPPAAGVEHLEWDSAFFGFEVGRVVGDPSRASLQAAFEADFELLYWHADSSDAARASFTREGYRLTYTDRRVTYASRLSASRVDGLLDAPGVDVVEWPSGPASAELLALAPVAGAFSRFQRDPRIPRERFETLYRTWMSRSSERAMADTVWVGLAGSRVLGFATGSAEGREGEIGLVAVSGDARGRGVGRALVAAVGKWMLTRGVEVSTVVTQRDNLPACRLYERTGFEVHSETSIHHLWRDRGLG